MLLINHLTIEIPRPSGVALTIIEDLSLHLLAGEIFGIFGPNGSGKSLLIEILAGNREPSAGKIHHPGGSPASIPTAYVCQRSQIPEPNSILFDKLPSVGENPMDKALAETYRRLRYKRESGIPLSGGEYQLAALAHAFLSNPALLLLDEPFSLLDSSSMHIAMNWLRAFVRENKTVLITSCHLTWLEEICDRIGTLHAGRLRLNEPSRDSCDVKPDLYLIRIGTRLDKNRAAWFDGLQLLHSEDETIITGRLDDQAALFGVLEKIRDMGISLVSVNRLRGHDSFEAERLFPPQNNTL